MLIRREDFKKIVDLKKYSKKKVWFVCDSCGIGKLQAYKNYIKSDTDLCMSCRRKEVVNRKEIKESVSRKSKERWKDPVYREKMSKVLSIGCKKSWDNNKKRKEWLSKNNPMYDYETKKRVSESEAIPDEEITAILKKMNYTFIKKTLGVRGGSIVDFKCDNGHFDSRRLDAIRHGAMCRYCQPISKGESALREHISKLIPNDKMVINSRKIIPPYEIDIYLPDYNLAFEYNGLYWHSEEKGKDENYHLNKTKFCEKKGIRLIHVFEDEWLSKKDIVYNRINYVLNKTNKRIYARKCNISSIETKIAKKFCEKNHIQGYGNSSIKLGMFYENELVSVMTFSKPNLAKGSKNKNDRNWELNRFCSSVVVVGGFSKILQYFKSNYIWDFIYSYVDRRWNTGNSYKKLNFKFDSFTKPNYWYFKTINNEIIRYHRFKFRKSQLHGHGTERDIMKRNGWNRIWDCGNIKYVMENKNSLS